jgi:hypothetical protein
MELMVEGVSKNELEPNSGRVKEIFKWVVNNGADLAGQEVQVDDSVSVHEPVDDEPVESDFLPHRPKSPRMADFPSVEGMSDSNTMAAPDSLAHPYRRSGERYHVAGSDEDVTKLTEMANDDTSEHSFDSASYSYNSAELSSGPPLRVRDLMRPVFVLLAKMIIEEKAKRLSREEAERLEHRSWIRQKEAIMRALDEEERGWLAKRS